MTSDQQPRPRTDHRTSRLGWVDYIGMGAAAAVAAGVWVLFGYGWALVAAGVMAGGLWALLEVILNPQIYPLIQTAVTGKEPRRTS